MALACEDLAEAAVLAFLKGFGGGGRSVERFLVGTVALDSFAAFEAILSALRVASRANRAVSMLLGSEGGCLRLRGPITSAGGVDIV